LLRKPRTGTSGESCFASCNHPVRRRCQIVDLATATILDADCPTPAHVPPDSREGVRRLRVIRANIPRQVLSCRRVRYDTSATITQFAGSLMSSKWVGNTHG